MRSREEVTQVLALAAAGLNSCEVARRTGIPRARSATGGWADGPTSTGGQLVVETGAGGTCVEAWVPAGAGP